MDDIEIIVTARTNKVGSKDETVVSFDREDWEAMSETERDEAALEAALNNLIEFDWQLKTNPVPAE